MSIKTYLVSAAAGAALLAGSSASASAQPYWGGGYRSFAPMSSAEYFRQLRACQRHDRTHRELGQEHAYEHGTGGVQSRGDHYDQHGALDGAHEAYHDDNPRADFCNRMIRSSRYRDPYGYWNRTYGRSGYGYGFGAYGNGPNIYYGTY